MTFISWYMDIIGSSRVAFFMSQGNCRRLWINLTYFLSHLLVAGCDIGVRFSVRPSVRPSVCQHLCRRSTFMSK